MKTSSKRLIVVVVVAAIVGVVVAVVVPTRAVTVNNVLDKAKAQNPNKVASEFQPRGLLVPRPNVGHAVLVTPENVSEDPMSANYDPMKLMDFKQWTSREIFENEPRDPKFADAREKVLNEQLAHVLTDRFPGAKVKEVVCKMTSCQVDLDVEESAHNELYMFLQRFVWGNTLSPGMGTIGPDGRGSVAMNMVYDRSMLDSGAYEQWFADMIKERQSFNDELWEQMFGGDRVPESDR